MVNEVLGEGISKNEIGTFVALAKLTADYANQAKSENTRQASTTFSLS